MAMAMPVNHTRRGFSRVIGWLSVARDSLNRVRWIGFAIGCSACGRGFFNPLPADSSLGSDATPAGPPIAFVQGQSGSSSAPYLKLNFPTAQVAGNTNVLVVSWISGSPSVVMDDAGNQYATALGPITGPTGLSEVVYFASDIAGGQNAVQMNFSNTPALLQGAIYEYAHVATADAVDNATGLFGSGGVQAASGVIQLTSDGDVLLAAIADDTTSSTTIDGYSLRTITPTMLVEDIQAPTSGQYVAATSDTESGDWVTIAVGFRRQR